MLFSFILLLSIEEVKCQNSNLAMYDPTNINTYYLSTNTDYFVPFFMKDMGPQFSHEVKYSYSVNGSSIVHQTTNVDHNNTDNCVNAIG